MQSISLKQTKPNKFNQSKITIPMPIKLGDKPIFFIEFRAMQGWTAATRDGVTRKSWRKLYKELIGILEAIYI